MSHANFNAILESCLERMAGGDSVERCLADYPQHAQRLRPLLKAAHTLYHLPRVRPRLSADIAIQQRLKQRMLYSANHPQPANSLRRLLTRRARLEKEPTLMRIFSSSLRSLLPRLLATGAIIAVILFAALVVPNMVNPDPDNDTALEAPQQGTEEPQPAATAETAATPEPTMVPATTKPPAATEPPAATDEPAATAIAATATPPAEFAIYLASGEIPVMPDLVLSQLELAEEPLLTADDILAYEAKTHLVSLTAAASQRLTDLNVVGNLFVVTVGRERIYYGGFMAAYMSRSYDGVVILWPSMGLDESTLQIELGYPGPDFFVGVDPRSDSRIMDALERVGKLH
jgi:hypothetical protein